MSNTTFSKSKVIFFIILFVFNFLLTATSGFFVDRTYGDVEIVLVIVRAVSIIPVIALVKHKKAFPIALLVMLILDFLLVRGLSAIRGYKIMVELPHPMFIMDFVYSIFRLVIMAFIIVSVIFINYSKKKEEPSSFAKLLPVLALVASALLFLSSFSISFRSGVPWQQTGGQIVTILVSLSLSIGLILYFSSFLSQTQNKEVVVNKKEIVTKKEEVKIVVPPNESRFTGTTFGLVWLNIWTGFVTGITFGIAFPFMLCAKEKWMAKHTYINGRQLNFDGTGMQLFGNWIKWSLLVLVTLGIYGFFIPIAIKKWTVSHIKVTE